MENTVGRDRRVLIAGGGIGGLAAGAALANLGFRVTMAEVRRSYFSQRSDEQKFESLAWLYSDRAGEKFQ